MTGTVTAVSRSEKHSFSKILQSSIQLAAGLGVEFDVHSGETVKHRAHIRRDPSKPNLRQVHLIHSELHDELMSAGFSVAAGQLGENITTRGVDLLGLPTDTRLHVGKTAIIGITGLRNPCRQLNTFSPGLLAAVLGCDEDGNIVLKCGVMGVVLAGGEICPGDLVRIELPPEPYQRLDKV